MSLEKLVTKYINSSAHVLREMKSTEKSFIVELDKVKEVLKWARAYLEDAEHFREKKKLNVSLTSVAYCEGLLDALRLLGAVSFEWPETTRDQEKERQF